MRLDAHAWREVGSSYNGNESSVAQFVWFDVDDLGYPFKAKPLNT